MLDVVGTEPALEYPTVGSNKVKTAIAIFAHPDDAELTCFGTLARLRKDGYRTVVALVTTGLSAIYDKTRYDRIDEAHCAASEIDAQLVCGSLDDGNVAHDVALLHVIEQWLHTYDPDIVITHCREPKSVAHQDHLTISEAVSNAVHRRRTCRMLLYAEPPKPSVHFQPNLSVDISSFHDDKIAAIRRHTSQQGKWYFDDEILNMRSRWWTKASYYDPDIAERNGSDTSPKHVEVFELAHLHLSERAAFDI